MKKPIYIRMIVNNAEFWRINDCGFIVKLMLSSRDSLVIIIQINNQIIECNKHSFDVTTEEEYKYYVKEKKELRNLGR